MKIVIAGKPVPQRRPEVRVWGGKAMGYDPSAPLKQEVLLLLKASKQLPQSIVFKGVPLHIKLDAYMPIAKSLSKKKQKELDGQYHIKRPDWDNIYKFYTDILEGYVYDKDECLCDFSGSKIYSFNPRVEIEIKPV